MRNLQRGRQSFNAGRYSRVQYNYDTSAGALPDFSKISDQYVRNKEFQLAAQDRVNQRLEEQKKQLRDESEIVFTGNKDADAISLDIQGQIRETLSKSKDKIDGKNYTLKDHNNLYNKLMTSAKTYGGYNEFLSNEFKRVQEDPNLSGAVMEVLTRSVGSIHDKNYKNAFTVDENDGSLIMTRMEPGKNEGDPDQIVSFDMKSILTGSAPDIQKFDPMANVKEMQSIYADVQKDAELGIEKYGSLQAFVTTHAQQQTAQFEEFKTNTVETFKGNKNKMISYIYDHMGIGFGGDDDGMSLSMDKDGDVIIPQALMDKAVAQYTTEIDAAFGVKTTKSGQIIPKPKVIKSGKAKGQDSFVSPGFDPNSSDKPMTQQSLKNMYSLDRGAKFEYSTAKPALQEEYKANNPDFYDENGNEADFNTTPTPEMVKSGARGSFKRVDALGVSFGDRFSSTDVTQIAINSRGGVPISKPTGFTFTEDAVLVPVDDPDAPDGVRYEVEYVPTSISLVGQVVKSKSKREEVQEGSDPKIASDGTKSVPTDTDVQQRQQTHESVSKPLSINQVNDLATVLGKSHPGFEEAFDAQLKQTYAAAEANGISRGKAEQDNSLFVAAFRSTLNQFKRGR